MPRRKAESKRRTRRAENPEDLADELEDEQGEEGEELETSEVSGAPPLSLVPERAEDSRQVYLRRPDTGETQSFSRENYERLTQFVGQMPDRSSYSLFIYRLTKVPGEGVKRLYLGQVELPMGLLDDALKTQFGGGEYFWQLGKDGHFAGRNDLPADNDDVKLSGNCTVAGMPKEIDEPVRAPLAPAANPANDAMLGMLKDQIKQAQADKNSSTGSMVQLMTVLLAGMQQQQSLAQQMSQQQTTFMMGLMAAHDKKSEEVSSVKDKMYEKIIDMVVKMGGGGASGEPESPWAAIAKGIPDLIRTIRESPGLTQVSPRKDVVPVNPARALPAPRPVAPAPAPVPMPVEAPGPAPIPAVPESETDFVKEDESYLMEVVKNVWEHFAAKKPLGECAQAVANLGEEEQFDKLLAQSNDWVANLTRTAWNAFNPGEAVPEGLLSYARAVHMDLTSEVPAVVEARPEPQVVAVPVVAVVSPPASPASPAAPAAAEQNDVKGLDAKPPTG